MTNHKSKAPVAIAGIAVAAAAAGTAAFVMNHTTCRSRKRAIRRAAGKMGNFMNSMVEEVSRNIMG